MKEGRLVGESMHGVIDGGSEWRRENTEGDK